MSDKRRKRSTVVRVAYAAVLGVGGIVDENMAAATVALGLDSSAESDEHLKSLTELFETVRSNS